MESRLTELWLIFDFINPGYLGSSGEFSRREQSLYLHGATPRMARDEMVARFQGTASNTRDNYNIFILSLKAGGLGLNLTANHVFHFDRWWNPVVENKATDRSHRIGQNRHVMVYKHPA